MTTEPSDQSARDDLRRVPGQDTSQPTVGRSGKPDPKRGSGFYGTGTDDLRAGTRNDPNRAEAPEDQQQPS